MRKYVSLIVAICYLFVVSFSIVVRGIFEGVSQVVSLQNKLSIVIDAGHGGLDGGVSGKETKVKESDLNLSIAYLLQDLFLDAGFLVTLTRKTEFGLTDGISPWTKKGDMAKRREIIRETNPDLVLSIHQNALAFNRSTRGAQVFYKRGKEEDKKLALIIQDALNAVYARYGVKSRTVMTGVYYMLECANVPSLIIECGFLSNSEDEKLLLQDSHRKQIASSIFTSVLASLT